MAEQNLLLEAESGKTYTQQLLNLIVKSMNDFTLLALMTDIQVSRECQTTCDSDQLILLTDIYDALTVEYQVRSLHHG